MIGHDNFYNFCIATFLHDGYDYGDDHAPLSEWALLVF